MITITILLLFGIIGLSYYTYRLIKNLRSSSVDIYSNDNDTNETIPIKQFDADSIQYTNSTYDKQK